MARASVVFAMLVFLVTGESKRSKDRSPDDLMLALAKDIEAEKILKVEVVCIPESAERYEAVTPDRLDKSWGYKFIVRDFRWEPLAGELATAIRETQFSKQDSIGDYRWGFHFYNSKNRETAKFYADQFGQMIIDGKSVDSKGPLLKTLHKFCPACANK